MKKITIYLCDKCGEEYRSKIHCERHEQSCKAQNCEMCVHFNRFYGGKERCTFLLVGKECEFELKETK